MGKGKATRYSVAGISALVLASALALAFGASLSTVPSAYAQSNSSSDPSWTVSSTADWWNNSSPSENDVRTTISNGSLKLTGENAVAYWSMDEFPSGFGSTDNTIYDLTSHQFDGTAENGPTITTGKWDNALSFDNVNEEFVQHGAENGLYPNNDVSFCVWFKTTSSSNEYILQHWRTAESRLVLRVGATSAGEVEWIVEDEGGTYNKLNTTGSAFNDGNWHFAVGTYDDSTGDTALYVDGNLENSTTNTLGVIDPKAEINIGRNGYSGGTSYFDGSIDEPMIFNRALSENEIKRIYNRTKPDNLAGDDLKTGTWTSSVWDSGATSAQQIENIDYSAVIDSSTENIWWDVEATDTNENTGWFQDPNYDNFIAQDELSDNIRGENFQVSIKLQTDNTTHSPSVQDYTLNVSAVGGIITSTNSAENIGLTEADLSGTLENLGGNASVDNVGFFWKISSHSDWNKAVSQSDVSTAPENFSYSLTSLLEDTQYDFKAFGENTTFQDNGLTKSFETSGRVTADGSVKWTDGYLNRGIMRDNIIYTTDRSGTNVSVIMLDYDNGGVVQESAEFGTANAHTNTAPTLDPTNDNIVYAFGMNGNVVRYNIPNDNFDWSISLGGEVQTNRVPYMNGYLYEGLDNGTFYKIDAGDGSIAGTLTLDAPGAEWKVGPRAVRDENILYTYDNKYLYRIDATSMTVEYSTTINANGGVTNINRFTPAIVQDSFTENDRYIIVASSVDNAVFAYEDNGSAFSEVWNTTDEATFQPRAMPAYHPEKGWLYVNSFNDEYTYVFDVSNGSLVFSFPFYNHYKTNRPQFLTRDFLVAYSDRGAGATDYMGLYRVDSGELVDAVPLTDSEYHCNVPYLSDSRATITHGSSGAPVQTEWPSLHGEYYDYSRYGGSLGHNYHANALLNEVPQYKDSSWTADSQAEWYWNASDSEIDARATVDNTESLGLSGENEVLRIPLDKFPSGFGSTDNTVYDLTSWQNDGTAVNGPTITSGRWDNALDFGGDIDARVNVPDNPSLRTGRVTVSVWFHTSGWGSDTRSYRMMVSKGYPGATPDPSWFICGSNDNTLHGRVRVGSENIDISCDYTPDGTWHLFTMTYDGEILKIYLDDSLKNSDSSMSGDLNLGTENVMVGGNVYQTGDREWHGLLDEPRIFDRALSENEIQRIYNRTKPSSLTSSDDIKTGTWASSIWDTGNTKQQLENVELSSTVGTGENLYANLTVYDSGSSQIDNTGWTDIEGVSTWTPTVKNGYQYSVDFRLETDNTTHSPSVQDYTLNVSTVVVPNIENITVDNTLIDRDIDYSGSGAVDAVQITVRVRDNDNRSDIAPLRFSLRDNSDFILVDNIEITENSAVDENTLDFTYIFNPSDTLPDDNLGKLDVRSEARDSAGACHVENFLELGHEEFTVSDRVVENVTFENDYEHVLKVTADSARVAGPSASVTSSTLTDNNLGDYSMGSDLAVSYKTTQDGEVTVKATDDNIDGISSSKPYIFPNFRPSIESVSVDNDLIDRSDDSGVFSSLDNATITVAWSDPDNRTNDLTSEADALLSVRDNTDAIVLSEENIIGTKASVDENTIKTSYTFNPSDSLGGENIGGFDVKFKGVDKYGMENVSGYTELGENLFTVTDLNTTLNISDTNPAKGDTITISGTASRAFGTVSLDNVMVEINGKLHQADFDNDNWSYQHTVQASGGSTVDVEIHLLDRGSSLDGYSSGTFTVQGAGGGGGGGGGGVMPSRELNIKLQTGHYKDGEFKPSSKFMVGERVAVVAYLTIDSTKISHGEVNGFWNGNSFTFEDRKANRFVGTFTIPKGTKPGSYLVSVDASARGLQSTVSKTITVQRAKKGINLVKLIKDYWWLIAIVAVILLLIALE